MKYVDFKKFTDENGALPIYLFEGEETYFRERGAALLLDRFLKEPTLDYTAFDGAALKGDKLKALADAVSCFPFLSEKRFVKISEFYPTEKEYDFYLKGIFENPPRDSVLLIVNSGKGKTGSAPLAKKPNVTHIDCGRSDEETIKKWIYVTCKRSGVYADGTTCGKIGAYCIYDMSRISKETEKLLLYCKAKGADRLTDQIVDEVVYPDSEYKIYELAKRAFAQKLFGVHPYSQRAFLQRLRRNFPSQFPLLLLQRSLRGVPDEGERQGDRRRIGRQGVRGAEKSGTGAEIPQRGAFQMLRKRL